MTVKCISLLRKILAFKINSQNLNYGCARNVHPTGSDPYGSFRNDSPIKIPLKTYSPHHNHATNKRKNDSKGRKINSRVFTHQKRSDFYSIRIKGQGIPIKLTSTIAFILHLCRVRLAHTHRHYLGLINRASILKPILTIIYLIHTSFLCRQNDDISTNRQNLVNHGHFLQPLKCHKNIINRYLHHTSIYLRKRGTYIGMRMSVIYDHAQLFNQPNLTYDHNNIKYINNPQSTFKTVKYISNQPVTYDRLVLPACLYYIFIQVNLTYNHKPNVYKITGNFYIQLAMHIAGNFVTFYNPAITNYRQIAKSRRWQGICRHTATSRCRQINCNRRNIYFSKPATFTQQTAHKYQHKQTKQMVAAESATTLPNAVP
jgi:hypothetical protein